ncbi:MAG: hypothetical protein K2F71_00640 [Paramuribaculum sp.]|nr:hypothetical protein [Paramuribaculum sp.]
MNNTSYSDYEDTIADAETAVANPPVRAGYPARLPVIRPTTAPAKKFDFFARFCVFRE